MQEKIEKLEEIWERQERFFPSLSSCRECYFPRKFEYYRYIRVEQLARYLGRLNDYIDDLEEMGRQVDRALEWSASIGEEEYRFFLGSFGWVLAASGHVLECWRDVADLESNYDKIMAVGDGIGLVERVEILNDFRDTIYSRLHYLKETIKVIRYVTSLEPKPVPFFTMRRYKEGELVVSIYNKRGTEEGICEPYVLRVRNVSLMYGEQHISAKPLSEKELAELPVGLPTGSRTRVDVRSSWIMPLQMYCFYLEHLDVLAEHWRVLNESGLLVPMRYEALSTYFGV